MIHFEREVCETDLIEAMLDMFEVVVLSLNDDDGYPYSVPVNFGYECSDDGITFYIHFMKRGHKVELMRKDPRVTLQLYAWNDFFDHPYKGHKHDYRSVSAKGNIRIIDLKENPELFEHSYRLLMSCNGRTPKPLSEHKGINAMNIGEIFCPWDKISAKSEFPLRTVEDVPFINVYERPEDNTPFDISDIIAKRKKQS